MKYNYDEWKESDGYNDCTNSILKSVNKTYPEFISAIESSLHKAFNAGKTAQFLINQEVGK